MEEFPCYAPLRTKEIQAIITASVPRFHHQFNADEVFGTHNGGHLPEPESNGRRYLKIPLNALDEAE